MADGGRIGLKPGGIVEPGVMYYARKSPTKINEELFKKIDELVAEAGRAGRVLGKKGLGEGLGYKVVEPGKSSGQSGINKIINAWEESRDTVFEFKPAKFTKDSPKVKQVIKLFEGDLEKGIKGMSKRTIAHKMGMDTKEIRNIFHQFAPEYIGDENHPTGEGKNAVKKRRKLIEKEMKAYWKNKPGGKEMLEEMNKKLKSIKDKNLEIIKKVDGKYVMTDQEILNNKMFREAMGLDVKGLKVGEGINFNRYANLTDADYVAKIRAMAKTNRFYQPEHLISINKNNPASMIPKNIYTATGQMGGQLEVLKNYVISNPKGEYVSLIDELFTRQGLPTSEHINRELLTDLSTAEGRLANRQKGTVKILNKILENNKIYDLSELAEKDPAGFLKAVKEHELASKILNKPGLVKGALRGLSGWAKGELGPFGWIGSLATIDAAFGVYELGQGATPLQALDTTLWFLPKSWLKADEKMFENVYKKAGFTDEDFGEFQKWRELEDLDKQYFMSQKQLKFMQDQVLKPENKSAADRAYQKEVDAVTTRAPMYKNMGWMYPKFTISSEQEKTGEHPFYERAVNRHNRILTKSQDVYNSLKDKKKSRKDLEYSRKLAAMERANRKKQMHLATLEGQLGYGESMEEILDRSGNLDLLYPEYVHPIEGPSVSAEQMRAAGFAGGGLTRTVARDSRPMEQGLRSLYINDKDY
jgi:hypothetical protein